MQIYNFKYQTRMAFKKTSPHLELASVIVWHAKSFWYGKAKGSSSCSLRYMTRMNESFPSYSIHLSSLLIHVLNVLNYKMSKMSSRHHLALSHWRTLSILLLITVPRAHTDRCLGSCACFCYTKLKDTSLWCVPHDDLSQQYPSVLSRGHPAHWLAETVLCHF